MNIVLAEHDYPTDIPIQIESDDQLVEKAGQFEVCRFIRRTEHQANLNYWDQFTTFPEDWDWRWEGKRGALTKRIGAYLAENYKIKLKDSEKAELGAIAKQFIRGPSKAWVDFTYDFDWKAGQYGDDRSCFWGGKAGSRIMIENENGFALRGYQQDEKNTNVFHPKSRCWIVPVGKGWVVFNGYGWPTLTFAQIFAQLVGQDYTHVALSCLNSGTMFFNEKSTGYYIGETTAKSMALNWKDVKSTRNCDLCARLIDGNLRLCKVCASKIAEPIAEISTLAAKKFKQQYPEPAAPRPAPPRPLRAAVEDDEDEIVLGNYWPDDDNDEEEEE